VAVPTNPFATTLWSEKALSFRIAPEGYGTKCLGGCRSTVRSVSSPFPSRAHTVIEERPHEADYARFDTEKNERHHADRFWALALAVHAAGLGKGRRRARQKVSASIV